MEQKNDALGVTPLGSGSTLQVLAEDGSGLSIAIPDAYDSTPDTQAHIDRVNQLLCEAARELAWRGSVHDQSKLTSPEKELFDEYTPKLKDCTYGSDEYKAFLSGLKPALDHHYAHNSHHPEHYSAGVNDFDLFDLVEMFFDWKAATERMATGNIFKSIDINRSRFSMSDQLCSIFSNTATRLGYKSPSDSDTPGAEGGPKDGSDSGPQSSAGRSEAQASPKEHKDDSTFEAVRAIVTQQGENK